MKTRTTPHQALAAILITTFLVACDASVEPTAPQPQAAVLSQASVSGDSEVSAWLGGLRGATAPFHMVEAGAAAGWDTPITDCLSSPDGGMGYHYGNLGLFDGVVEELAPETLLYEPQQNGRLRLVAVEYIVPFDFVPSDATPPSLHGVDFHQNFVFGVWALHAWIWRHNPSGMFSDWNPNVTCDFAP